MDQSQGRNNAATRHERVIVKLSHLKPDRYLVYAEHHAGMQYRSRKGIPPPLLELLDQGDPVFAYAYVDAHNGRWRLIDVAAAQSW